MRRKNSETFPPESHQVPISAPDHDAYDAKEKLSIGGGGGGGEEKKSDTPPPRPKEAHVSFYDRQEIKKLEYSNVHGSKPQPLSIQRVKPQPQQHQQLSSSKRRQRPLLLDIMCLSFVAAVCVGLSGVSVGFQQRLTASTTNSMWMPFRNDKKQKTTQLPPNTNLPPHLLASSVQRHAISDTTDNHNMPLLFVAIQTQRAMLQHMTKLQQQQQQLNNSTTTAGAALKPKHFSYPRPMEQAEFRDGFRADFGTVDLRFLTENDHSRKIYRERWEREGTARTLDQERDDDVEQYWAHDDDWLRYVRLYCSIFTILCDGLISIG